ncbi:MAG: contractile injection system tape measure protein [Bacteroidia bacterium]
MADEKHIIKRAVIELHIPAADNAMGLQNKALSFFKEKICPMIEKIVDKYSASGETIRIDKLELDFQKFNPENLNEIELRKFEQQIEEKLIKLISEERNNNNFSGDIITAVKKIPKEKADEELFLHLLKNGSLPWWAKTEESISLDSLAQKVIQQSADSIKKDLKKALVNDAVRKRIAYKLSTEAVEKLISLISTPDLLRFINEIINLLEDENSKRSIYEYTLKYFSTYSELNKRLFISTFVKEKGDVSFAEKLYKGAENKIEEIDVIIKKSLADLNEHFSDQIKKIFNTKDVEEYFSDQIKNIFNAKEALECFDPKDAEQKLIDKQKTIDKTNEEDLFIETVYEEEAGDYFIKNSGIIILAPYLSILFKELGLCDDKIFISDEAKEKAAYLLQFLATGNEESFEEHEMVLNKILCGIEIETPLILPFSISEKEKEECLNLLQAVANNWTALKGTSGEGMRDAFFMRDGILEKQSNGWDLKIEKTTIDILLDKLPWGISIIQMPWSTEMVFVNW